MWSPMPLPHGTALQPNWVIASTALLRALRSSKVLRALDCAWKLCGKTSATSRFSSFCPAPSTVSSMNSTNTLNRNCDDDLLVDLWRTQQHRAMPMKQLRCHSSTTVYCQWNEQSIDLCSCSGCARSLDPLRSLACAKAQLFVASPLYCCPCVHFGPTHAAICASIWLCFAQTLGSLGPGKTRV